MKKISTVLFTLVLTATMPVMVMASQSPSASDFARETSVNTEVVYTLPTGEVINDTLVNNYASSITTNDNDVAAIDITTTYAYSQYIITTYGTNSSLVATYKSVTPVGKTVLKCKKIIKGFKYYILVQLKDGRLLRIEPTRIDNGQLIYNKPAGVISEALVVDATAPK